MLGGAPARIRAPRAPTVPASRAIPLSAPGECRSRLQRARSIRLALACKSERGDGNPTQNNIPDIPGGGARAPLAPVRQNARDDLGVFDARDHLQPSAAARAALDLDPEYPLQSARPAQGQVPRRRALGRAGPAVCPRPAARRRQRRAQRRMRGQHPVKARQSEPLELRALIRLHPDARVQRKPRVLGRQMLQLEVRALLNAVARRLYGGELPQAALEAFAGYSG